MMCPEDKTRIVFTGDIAFSQYFQNGWEQNGCVGDRVKNFLHSADFVVANMECPLTNKNIISDRALNHVSNPKAGEYISGLNINIWNLANNHIMDCGVGGLKDTIEIAKKNNCQTIGVGLSLDEAFQAVILGTSVKIGLFSVASSKWRHIKAGDSTPGAASWDEIKYLENIISNLRKKVDWIVLVVHGGDEYCDIALPYMRERYHALLKMGIDIIIGHHSHVVQNYEYVDNKIIFYSLGNFIFDTANQRKFFHTDHGVLIGIDFSKSKFVFDFMTVCIDREKQIVKIGNRSESFQEISENNYKKIWPLQARVFYSIDLINKKNLHEKLRSANRFVFLLHEIGACRHKKERVILWGRILSVFGKWKDESVKDLRDYLLEHYH